LKVSLFDVSDLKNPKESASFVVPQLYSSSTALFESRAFLFSREKELLAIPGYFYEPESGQNFNGAFVFKITKS
jgi:inhibitor of cysteine peptidase